MTGLFQGREVVLCVGPGGVGKTTTAASIALHAALRGRKVVVVTIDPSRRLGQALGIDTDPSTRGSVVPVLRPETHGAHLDALLLDSASVFDVIVHECAKSPEAAERITSSRIYGAMAQSLGGALEYAAMARVQMLHAAGEHDLIVLDTPPTANALDFLDAPKRIHEVVDNPAAKLVVGTGKLGGKILGLGGAMLMRTLRAIGGGEFLKDLGEFLGEFADVIEEFNRRGGDFETMLASTRTGVVLVTSASVFSVREGIAFLQVLMVHGLRIEGVVLNRVDPPLPPLSDRDAVRAAVRAAWRDADESAVDAVLSQYGDARSQGARGAQAREEIRKAHPGMKVWTAPRMVSPPHDLSGLSELGASLFDQG